MLDYYWTWILANKEWLFSGVGVVAIGVLVKFLRRRDERGVSQKVRGGASSQNLQAGRDIHLTVGEGNQKTQSPRQQFVEDLLTFCSESKSGPRNLNQRELSVRLIAPGARYGILQSSWRDVSSCLRTYSQSA